MTIFNGVTYSYNLNGRLQTTVGAPDGDWTYDYTADGALLSAVSAGETVEYLIDGKSRRIGRRSSIDNSFVYWMYKDDLSPIAEMDDQFRLRKVFVYGLSPNVPDYMVVLDVDGNEAGMYRFVADQVGSIRGLIDASNGRWVERTDYSPFGIRMEVIAASPELKHPFGFAGGIHDSSTGLVHFGAREYDPRVGRWTAPDPINFAGGDSNLYAYVGSNPIQYADPSGLAAEKSWYRSAGEFLLEEILWTVATGGAITAVKWAYRGTKLAIKGARLLSEALAVRGGTALYRSRRAAARLACRLRLSRKCFVAGTPVKAADGDVPIEDILAGDLVYSWAVEADETDGWIDLGESQIVVDEPDSHLSPKAGVAP